MGEYLPLDFLKQFHDKNVGIEKETARINISISIHSEQLHISEKILKHENPKKYILIFENTVEMVLDKLAFYFIHSTLIYIIAIIVDVRAKDRIYNKNMRTEDLSFVINELNYYYYNKMKIYIKNY